MPATSPLTAVLVLEALPIIAVFGPLVSDQFVDEILAPPLPEAVPDRLTELVGNVMACDVPALTVGGTNAGFTVMVTDAELVCPLLSVEDRRKVYTP